MAWQVSSAGTQAMTASSRWRAASPAVPTFAQPQAHVRDRACALSRLRASGVVHVATPSAHEPAAGPATVASAPSTSGVAPGQQAGSLLLSGGAFVLPHPDKMAKGGEDWFFISDSKRAMGVADGVGGWADIGVDAGAYARQLMNRANDAVERVASASNGSGPQPLSAQDILEVAYNQTRVMGSSTACVIVVNGSTLYASNLGDSGFMVLRGGQMLLTTTQQQHSFNFPFQIGASDAMGDHPRQADRYEVQLQPGDIIVAGTDGLWDNCFHEEIVSVLRYCSEARMSPSRSAQVLAHYARHRAADTKFASPFAYAAYQAGIKYLGGKMDDITIVVAYAEQQQPAQPMAKL